MVDRYDWSFGVGGWWNGLGWVGIWVVVGRWMGCKGFIFRIKSMMGGVEVVTKRDTCSI